MARDTAQQIADLQARLARLKDRERKRTTHQKVIVGAVMMTAALKDKAVGTMVLKALEQEGVRDTERASLKDFIAALKGEEA